MNPPTPWKASPHARQTKKALTASAIAEAASATLALPASAATQDTTTPSTQHVSAPQDAKKAPGSDSASQGSPSLSASSGSAGDEIDITAQVGDDTTNTVTFTVDNDADSEAPAHHDDRQKQDTTRQDEKPTAPAR